MKRILTSLCLAVSLSLCPSCDTLTPEERSAILRLGESAARLALDAKYGPPAQRSGK